MKTENKMAASMKRPCEQIHSDVPQKRVNKSDDDDTADVKLKDFLEWCHKNEFNLSSKVTVTRKGSCAQYGMVALEDIAESYCLFQVPRSCLLSPENTDIHDLIQMDSDKLTASNQWIPLLVSLIHEQSKSSSKWRPYLDLVPDYSALDLPIFWSKQDVDKFLINSRVDTAVMRDSKMIGEDFEKLVRPFFKRHAKRIGQEVKDVEHFKKQVAFVMAYSFTEPKDETVNGHNESDSEDEAVEEMSPPMMVPMADMLNHVTKNNAKLTFGTKALKMVTTRPIKKGEEIFNTYSQVSNLHLMHMYGFTEPYPDNIHDVVEVPVDVMLKAAMELFGPEEKSFVEEKWKFLTDREVVSEDEVFVIGQEGIISDEICMETLKVMCQSRAQFDDYQQNEGWSDAESDSSLSGESRLSFDKISKIEAKWKQLLKKMSEIHTANFPTSFQQDSDRLKELASSSTPAVGDREKFSLYLVHGQKMLLQSLINVCL